jgi:hypothetical protein
MSRSSRMFLFAVVLSLVLTPATYAREKPKPPPPEDGVVGTYEYPQRSTSGEVNASAQGSIVKCTVWVFDPSGGPLIVNGDGMQVCTAPVFQTIQVCIQVFRYYTVWQNLKCNPVKRSNGAVGTISDTASEFCLNGTYWYRIRQKATFVDVDGRAYASPYVYSFDKQIRCGP